MSEKTTKPRSAARVYSADSKIQAVNLAREVGNDKAAAELGIPKGTLGGWIRAAKNGALDTGAGTQTPETALTQAAEIQRLKAALKTAEKDISRLKEEREILEEACAFFVESRQKYKRRNGSNS